MEVALAADFQLYLDETRCLWRDDLHANSGVGEDFTTGLRCCSEEK